MQAGLVNAEVLAWILSVFDDGEMDAFKNEACGFRTCLMLAVNPDCLNFLSIDALSAEFLWNFRVYLLWWAFHDHQDSDNAIVRRKWSEYFCRMTILLCALKGEADPLEIVWYNKIEREWPGHTVQLATFSHIIRCGDGVVVPRGRCVFSIVARNPPLDIDRDGSTTEVAKRFQALCVEATQSLLEDEFSPLQVAGILYGWRECCLLPDSWFLDAMKNNLPVAVNFAKWQRYTERSRQPIVKYMYNRVLPQRPVRRDATLVVMERTSRHRNDVRVVVFGTQKWVFDEQLVGQRRYVRPLSLVYNPGSFHHYAVTRLNELSSWYNMNDLRTTSQKLRDHPDEPLRFELGLFVIRRNDLAPVRK